MSEDAHPATADDGSNEGEGHDYGQDDDFEDGEEQPPADGGEDERGEGGEQQSVDSGPREAPTEGDALDGVVYEGSWHRGKPHGYGTADFPDGTRYEGYWVEGKRHTEEGETSRCVFPNGNAYVGEFFADEIHGLGQLLNAQGEVLDPGPWEHNVSQYTPYPINGTGKYEFPDGSFYDGDWEEGLFHGQGTFAWKSSGDRYTGSFRRGQMHGHGRYEFRNGDAFDGTFVDGKPVGRGEYVWSREHQAYHGEWADGIQHGEGTHYYDLDQTQEGLRYEGGWDQGRQHGRGTLAVGDYRVHSTWLEGRNDQVDMNCFPELGPKEVHTFHFKGGTYTGTWKEHRPHGQGRMAYADGSVYDGEWREFRFHGQGKLTHSSGCEYEGTWRNGAPHGRGVMQRVPAAAPQAAPSSAGPQGDDM